MSVSFFKTRIVTKPFKWPQDLFLLTALLMFIYSFVSKENTIDIHLHDTMFVISSKHFIWAFAIICLSGWGLYSLTRKFLWTGYLSWIHVGITVFILCLCVTVNIWHDVILPPVKREVVSWETFQEDQNRAQRIYFPIAILFVVGQLAYIINILGGLTKRYL